MTDGRNTIPLPEGYEISEVTGENTIEDGVVIKDENGNEFVWIPVSTTFTGTYNGSSSQSLEPNALIGTDNKSAKVYDSQDELDYYYGENFYNYATDFAYNTHYEEMVGSVNTYGGFYIGRYETTIDDNGRIGSKYNTTILQPKTLLKGGTNPTSNSAYNYRWWGLYNAGRKMDVTGNREYVQTNMIWEQQWDAMINYFNITSIDYTAFGKSKQKTVVNSGQSTSLNDSEKKDCIYNIYDLRTNGYDWTAGAYGNNCRNFRGSYYDNNLGTVADCYNSYPRTAGSDDATRATLYIK